MAQFSSNIYPPTADSANNNLTSEVVGNKNDTHDGDSIRAVLHTLDEHSHKASNVYPTLASGATITGGAGAWGLGNFSEVVPVSSITSDFDIHYIDVEATSASDTYEIVLYAATTEISRVRITFIDVVNSQTLPSIPIQCAIQPANTQIQTKIATKAGGNDTIQFSLHYHTY